MDNEFHGFEQAPIYFSEQFLHTYDGIISATKLAQN